MRDLDALHAHLVVALALGLGGCDDGKATAAKADADESAPAAKQSEETPDEEAEEEAPRSPDGPGKGMGAMVTDIKAEAEAKAQAEAEALAALEALDPVEYCGSAEMTVTVDDAVANRMSPEDSLGCPLVTAPATGIGRVVLDDTNTQALRDQGETKHCCYQIIRVKRGRPLVVTGGTLLPAFELGARRTTDEGPVSLRVASAWLRDARVERASVDSFLRAAQELRELGAPRSLVAGCRTAADDERRHTALCLRMAERFSGRQLQLSTLPPLPPRPGGLLACLRRTFAEGCVAETAAALVALRAARRAESDIASILREIAEDEADHAALAWTTVGWGWDRLAPDERRSFLAWAHRQRPAGARPGADPDARHGCLSAASEQAIAAEAWDRCIVPLLSELERRSAPARPDAGSARPS